MVGMPSGTTDGSPPGDRSSTSPSAWSVRSAKMVNSIPPAIWKAGTVIPKTAKIRPPATMKTSSVMPAARHARSAARRRSRSVTSRVSDTKMGAAPMGFMTEKSEAKARRT